MIGMTQVPCRRLKHAAVEEEEAVDGDGITAEEGEEDDMILRLRHFPMASVDGRMRTVEVLPTWNKAV